MLLENVHITDSVTSMLPLAYIVTESLLCEAKKNKIKRIKSNR